METDEGPGIVATNVRRIRELRGLDQADVGRRLGWSTSTVSKVEAGHRRTTTDDLLALAVVLSVAPAFLLVPWEDGELVVRLKDLEISMAPEEAIAWVVGEAAPAPLLDPRDYFWTSPPSRRKRVAEILKQLEAAGLVSFPEPGVASFRTGGITRTVKVPKEED
jgi:transcriptional regulator with XRE-family HTH domain